MLSKWNGLFVHILPQTKQKDSKVEKEVKFKKSIYGWLLETAYASVFCHLG